MVSWLPHVTSFCCCLGLEAGAKVTGFLHLLLSLFLVVLCSYYSVQFHQYKGTVDDADGVYSTSYAVAVTVTLLSTAHAVAATVLLYGVYKRNTTALRAWVYVMLVLLVGGVLYNVVVSIKFGFAGSGSDIFLTFAEGFFAYCVIFYFIITINSYYMMVKSCEDMDGPKYDY
ncbi:uncharacterized protein LOC105396644 [Plutella xylostella]|uniref:uncharacterized protein LOC105396644 n=1 Tax=Plutella xylostella TaxID=51655 RepID=UPI0020331A57|nr:uncharacterized protein LOC105396644 [Plutella xylostella]